MLRGRSQNKGGNVFSCLDLVLPIERTSKLASERANKR